MIGLILYGLIFYVLGCAHCYSRRKKHEHQVALWFKENVKAAARKMEDENQNLKIKVVGELRDEPLQNEGEFI